MADIERIEERLTAVERTVVDGDFDLDELQEVAEQLEDLERLEAKVEDLERRLADVESRTDAVDGYVSKVSSVNEEVERQADAAVAAVDRVQDRIDELDERIDAALDAQGSEHVDTPHHQSSTGSGSTLGADSEAERAAGEVVAGDGANGEGGSGDGRFDSTVAANGDGTDQEVLDSTLALGGSDDEAEDEGLLASLRSRLP